MSLRSDQRGAIALLALFMAVFATALVYYVAGIGETVLQRERMQDAADAAAFSAAALHARGMNAIVLVNMVMAALLAVLVALKLIELITTMAILAIALASFFAPGLAGAIPPLAEVRQKVKAIHDELRPGIYSALDALHTTARGIRVLIPVASQQHVVESVRAHYAPPAQLAFAAPPRATLPTQDGSFATLCDRAGMYTAEVTEWAADKVLTPPKVGELLGGAVEELTRSRADWFCGTDGHPPRSKHEQTHEYPYLAARERCQQVDSQAPDYAQNGAAEHARICEQAELDEQDSTPDEDSGRCTRRCEPDGPYEQRAVRARRACAKDQDGDDPLYDFSWQERHYRRSYERGPRGWVRVSSDQQEQRSERHVRQHGNRRPCGPARGAIGPTWQVESVDATSGLALPLCSNAGPPLARGHVGQRVTLRHIDVTRIFGCKRTVVVRSELNADRLDQEEAETKVPQELLADVKLGEAPLQIRAAVIGELPPFGPEGVQQVATWGGERRSLLQDLLPDPREQGRVAIAQAEYFYALEDPATPPADFMWSMLWQARLRRVQLPGRRAQAHAAADQAEAPGPEAPSPVKVPAQASPAESLLPDALGAVPAARFESLAEACETALAAFELARGEARDEGEDEETPCATLERVLKTESLH